MHVLVSTACQEIICCGWKFCRPQSSGRRPQKSMRLREHEAERSVTMGAREIYINCCLLPVEKISVAAGRFADNKAMDPNLMAMHRWVSTAYRRISALWYLWKGGNSHMHKAIHASKAEKMAHIYKLLRRHRWPMITHYFTFRCDPCTCVEHKKGSCNA
jgi:hypothetical protein